jgi:transcriptional regulator with XRE-family HTH domain
MKSNKEKFQALVATEKTDTVARNKERIKNRARLRESQAIALKVLTQLDELGWSQRRLAQEMDVSPQQITKIVKGTENLTLETQVKLQEILDIPIFATYYEKKAEELIEAIKMEHKSKYTVPKANDVVENISLPKKEYSMTYDVTVESYEIYQIAG